MIKIVHRHAWGIVALASAILACGSAPVTSSATTPIATQSATQDSRPRDLIVDGSSLIGSHPKTVEGILGIPTQREVVASTNTYFDGILNGGEEAYYQHGPYLINVDFDSKLGATGFGLEGLGPENWNLDDWPILLGRVGIKIDASPDVNNPSMNLIWRNANGLYILITNDENGGHVEAMSIFLCKYSLQNPCPP